ncbi:MAG: hypothetical protein F8N36_14110 [Desulfovibrio sp.]|uniref:hypothetical protein n=1 Tax=Desulfovibrio sp. TaxID=885 RepID=UPI00135DAD95|nr:hypothetical protein [Desulfovibrio sp.]MTJ93973.1 hypothetical protein [Desulfovibrio sp.]
MKKLLLVTALVACAFGPANAGEPEQKTVFWDAYSAISMGSLKGFVTAADIVAQHKAEANRPGDQWRTERLAMSAACAWPVHDPAFGDHQDAMNGGFFKNDGLSAADVLTACHNLNLF